MRVAELNPPVPAAPPGARVEAPPCEAAAQPELLRDFLAYAFALVASGVIGLLTVPVFVRFLSAADYGKYVLMLATVQLLSSTAVSGLGSSIDRFLPGDRSRRENLRLVVTLAGLAVVAVGLTSLAALAAASWFPGPARGWRDLIPATVVNFAGWAGFLLVCSVFRARRKLWSFVATSIGYRGGGLLLAVLLFLLVARDARTALLGSGLAGLALTVLAAGAGLARVGFHSQALRPSLKLARQVVAYSLPLSLGNMIFWIMSLSDRYLLGLLLGSESVALYSVGYDLADKSLRTLSSAMVFAAVPVMTGHWEDGKPQEAREYLHQATRALLAISAPVAAILMVLAQPLVELLASPAYLRAAPVMVVVSLAGVVFWLAQLSAHALLLQKRTDLTFAIVSAVSLVNVVLNLLFIPRWGILAAACTTLFGYLCYWLASAYATYRCLGWGIPGASLARITAAGAVAAGACWTAWAVSSQAPGLPQPARVALSAALAVAAYLCAMRRFGELDILPASFRRRLSALGLEW